MIRPAPSYFSLLLCARSLTSPISLPPHVPLIHRTFPKVITQPARLTLIPAPHRYSLKALDTRGMHPFPQSSLSHIHTHAGQTSEACVPPPHRFTSRWPNSVLSFLASPPTSSSPDSHHHCPLSHFKSFLEFRSCFTRHRVGLRPPWRRGALRRSPIKKNSHVCCKYYYYYQHLFLRRFGSNQIFSEVDSHYIVWIILNRVITFGIFDT